MAPRKEPTMKDAVWPIDKIVPYAANASEAEEWRPIPGIAGYEVSSLGRARSLDRCLTFIGRWGVETRRMVGRVLRLKPKPNGTGGVYMSIHVGGGRYIQINRAVCEAFHGAPPSPQHEAAHLDGCTVNDHAANLLWATPVENAAHKNGHGTAPKGESNGMATLDDATAAEVVQRYAKGESAAILAAECGVSLTTVRGIASGRRWSHIETPFRQVAVSRLKANMYEAPRRNVTPRQPDAA